jgi:hypothetical protein
MNTNGNLAASQPLQPIPPVTSPPQVLQVAVEALKGIALQATTAVTKLEGLVTGPTPLSAPVAPAPSSPVVAEDASEAAEIEALIKSIPEAAATQLKLWRVQNELVNAAYPALVPPRPSLAPAAAPTNKITVQAFWWGFHFVVPEGVMAQWTAGGVTLAGVIAAIAGSTGPAAPFVAAGAAYVAAEVGLMKTVDRGKGVYVSMSWFAPGIFVPTSI